MAVKDGRTWTRKEWSESFGKYFDERNKRTKGRYLRGRLKDDKAALGLRVGINEAALNSFRTAHAREAVILALGRYGRRSV